MATLGSVFAGSAYAMRVKDKPKKQGPPTNSTSKDEEAFIQYAIPRYTVPVIQGVSNGFVGNS